jgi:GrpB-like predicted nucleotidyltransferase (UPF0157 family)
VLGLKYGTVALSPHDPAWANAFLEEQVRLQRVLPAGCIVEHIGSTAVQGLAAKPILDIAVGCPDGVASSNVVNAVESIGYQYRGDAGSAGGHVLVRESKTGVRTHHAHVVELGEPQWSAYLAFRDGLRSSAVLRETYERAKRRLALEHHDDRRRYTTAKDSVIASVFRQINGNANRR